MFRQRYRRCFMAAMLAICSITGANDVALAQGPFSVSNLDDSGDGSLRQAIEDANAAPGADVIEFAVAGTIQLTSGALPPVSDAVTIDGTTAPGFDLRPVETPLVEIDANGFAGLQFNSGSSGSTLQSIGIVDASSAGATLYDSQITLLGNFIGVELDGMTAAGNNGDGVAIYSSSNSIGAAHPPFADDPVLREHRNARNRNVISANSGNGIGVYGSTDNDIVANYIGVRSSGDLELGNAGNGILMTTGASFNVVVGLTPLSLTQTPKTIYLGKPVDGNVISGNDQNGVLVIDHSENNLLAGNFIGTDVSGNNAVGNTLDGVAIVYSDDNVLRGTHADQLPFVFYNVICGNGGNGLRILDSDNTGVYANFFGMAADNALSETSHRIGNAESGVLVEGRSTDTEFGGRIPLGSVTAANGKHGIEIRDQASGFVSDNTFSGTPAFYNTTDYGNTLDGLHITSTGGNILVQTSLFSANGDDGIEISGSARDVTIQQSIVGLSVTAPPGISPLPNGDNGIEIGGDAHNNFIGLTNPQFSVAPQNTIGGNKNNGVAIIGNANHNQVFGSYIGADVYGENPLGLPSVGNTHAGVFLGDNSHHNIIGGRGANDGNLISGNGGDGIQLGGETQQNQIIGNLVGSNILAQESVGNQGAGVFLGEGTHHNLIQDNLASDNFESGYDLAGSDHNRLIGNEAVSNLGDGFHLENSNFNILLENNADENGGFGFSVDAILKNVFEKNECQDNVLGGADPRPARIFGQSTKNGQTCALPLNRVSLMT